MLKRVLSVIIVVALCVGMLYVTAISGTAADVLGDVDGDTKVTVLDATAIQRHLASIIQLDAAAIDRGRVTGNDKLVILDATAIQRKLAGIIKVFPVEEVTPTQPSTAAPTAAPTQAPTVKPTEAPTQPVTQAPTEPDAMTPVKNSIPIYFSNNMNWSTVNAYVYKQSTGQEMSKWPGSAMKYLTTNNEGEKVYTVTVDVSKYDRVIFNNGSDQTTDTPVTKASSGYFIDPARKGKEYSGKYIAGVYPYGQNGEGNLKIISKPYPDGYNKKIYIWTPEGYNAKDKSKKYSVLYMCDGQNLFGDEIDPNTGLPTTLSQYEWECDESVLSLMQNGGDGIIVVGVEAGNPEEKRNHELTPNIGTVVSFAGSSYVNGGGKVFSDFMVNTVIPSVEQNYNTNSIRGIAGSSSGGIEAFYIGIEHMDKFQYIGALSPAFILYDQATWAKYLRAKDFTGDVPCIYFFCGNSPQDDLEKALYTNAVAMEGWMKTAGYPAAKMTTVTDADAKHNEGFWALYFPEMLSWCTGI